MNNRNIQRHCSLRVLSVLGSMLALLFVASAGSLVAQKVTSNRTEYDVVIRNGRMLDGAGNPWIRADVAIRDGRFVKIGLVPERGRVEIDASGKYVSPGWIDMMDHSGAVLLRNPLAENKLMMGVTTAIAGEGGTPVGATALPSYFRRLETQGISINFGSYFSETQARTEVLGESARAPDAAELLRMRAILDTAMRAGALGMTTALIYPPSSYATTAELIEVGKAVARYDGIYASHMRGEGKEVVQSVREAVAIGEQSGMPVEIFHLKVAYKPGWGVLMDSVRQVVDAARARGVDVAADMYVYTAGGTGLEATIPSWAFEGGMDSLKARLANPVIRTRLKQEQQAGSPGWWNIVEAAGGWGGIILANARNPANEKYVGKSIAQIAAETNRSPADAAFDLVLSEYGASIWADPSSWIPEAARLLRPGGVLVFLRNSTLSILCSPDVGAVGEQLVRPQVGMRRFDWRSDDGGIEFHLGHGDWVRLLRSNGFEILDLIELYAPEAAATHEVYNHVPVSWATQWPSEEIWVARKASAR